MIGDFEWWALVCVLGAVMFVLGILAWVFWRVCLGIGRWLADRLGGSAKW